MSPVTFVLLCTSAIFQSTASHAHIYRQWMDGRMEVTTQSIESVADTTSYRDLWALLWSYVILYNIHVRLLRFKINLYINQRPTVICWLILYQAPGSMEFPPFGRPYETLQLLSWVCVYCLWLYNQTLCTVRRAVYSKTTATRLFITLLQPK